MHLLAYPALAAGTDLQFAEVGMAERVVSPQITEATAVRAIRVAQQL